MTNAVKGIQVVIPTPLQRYVRQQHQFIFSGQTVGEVLTQLGGQYSELRQHLYGADGLLRSFVNVFVNDEDIRAKQGMATAVKDGDVVTLLPSVAGG